MITSRVQLALYRVCYVVHKFGLVITQNCDALLHGLQSMLVFSCLLHILRIVTVAITIVGWRRIS